MDTITHGIAGALIGKAFFAPESAPGGPEDPAIKTLGRTAILGATLGSVFPDSDSFIGLFTRDDLAIIRDHRYVTHSFVCLPVFAVLVALVVLAFARWRKWRTPSLAALVGICGVGIASHIFFDLITTFGTMIWSPLNDVRPAWDLVFIIDFTFTGIVLVPQVVAWIYRDSQQRTHYGWSASFLMWLLFTALAELALWLASRLDFSSSPVMAVLGPIVLAAVFLLPRWRDFGYRVRRSSWCRAGVLALAGYLLLCAGAHALAVRRVREFAAANGVQVEVVGAMPLPPSANYWEGLIRTSTGVYEGRFSLSDGWRSATPPRLRFLPDSPPDHWIEAAKQVPETNTYLWFARFPLYASYERGGRHFVEISDLRFNVRDDRAAPFRFRVTFDADGRVLGAGFIRHAD